MSTRYCSFVIAAVLLVYSPVWVMAQVEADNPDKFDQGSDEFPFRPSVRRSVFKLNRPHAGLPKADQDRVADNCLFGQPAHLANIDVGPTQLICRDGYVLEHSSDSKIPLWVCEHCTADELDGSLPRTNPFAPDPKLAPGERSELADYRGSGFDRGHMAPNGNQKVDDRLRIETFFLSNIVPQVGKKFNQSCWADLEGLVRKWAKKRDEVWIITGSMVYDPKEENNSTADGLVDVTVVGDNEVVVPTHLFKIVVGKRGDKWESLAFVFENRSYPKDEEFKEHLQTIDWIEERVGFDFLPNAKAETGDPSIESKLEATKAPALWD